MSSRASMGFDVGQSTVPGSVPDFGAIFMSNSATKQECFRRKLFGLPFSQAHFVKQVKAGMILFLFEFERRQLHGVFQACSDGAINIVPYAFNSTGKKFPAQVKFTTIWNCSPLSEDEFSDAIQENYFSPKKFNFGLSEDQVHRLLSLFSLRKLINQQPQRQLTSSEVRRAVDDGRFVMTDEVKDESNADSMHGSVILPKYLEGSFGNSGRLSVDGRFATSSRIGNVHKVDNEFGLVISNEYGGDSLDKIGRVTSDSIGSKHNENFECGPSISTEYPGYYSGSVRRVLDDVRFATSDRLEIECNDDNGFKPAFSTEFPGVFQANLNTSAYSCKPILEADSLGPYSTSGYSMDSQIYNLSYPTSYSDANVTTSLPYDPDAPSINYRSLPYFEVSQSSAPSQNSYVGTFPSYENQSFSHFPLPYFNNSEYSCRRGMPFSGAAYSESMARNSSEDECHRGDSVPKPSFTPVPFPESENNRTINKGPSSYFISPNKYTSFGFDYGYLAASRDRLDYPMPQCEKNEAFTVNVPMFEGDECRLQGFVSSIESQSVEHYENTLLNTDVSQNSDIMHSDSQKNRNSVFSRLGLASEVGVKENGTPVGYCECQMDTSVDEIMGLLHQSHFQWVRMRYKPVIRRYDAAAAAANSRNKMETTFNSKLLRDHLAVISKEMSMKAGEENDNQMVEGTPFVDYKRRSKMRNIHDDTMTSSSNETPESKGSSGGQHKKRKLIRPNFNKDEPPDEKGINGDISQDVQVASLVSSVSEDNTGSCEVLVRSRDNESKTCKNVELPHVMCQIGLEDKNVGTERGLKCEGEKVESCGASFKSADEDGKQLFENAGYQNVHISVSCKENCNNGEEGLSIKDSMVQGLPQDCNNKFRK